MATHTAVLSETFEQANRDAVGPWDHFGRVRFTVELWDAWRAARTPTERDAERARGIREMRVLLEARSIR